MSVMEMTGIEVQELDRDIRETLQRLQDDISIARMPMATSFRDLTFFRYPVQPEVTSEPLPDLRSAVEFGARELDRLRPGWFMDINLDTLNLKSSSACILGQLFGGFGNGVVELGLMKNDASCKMGLNVHCADYQFDMDAYDDAWAELNKYWPEEVEKRLDAAVA